VQEEHKFFSIFFCSSSIFLRKRLKCLKKALPTRLQVRRKNNKLTQRKLIELAGVNLRTIQQYEERSKDINKDAGATLRSLAQVLSCRIEDILEY